MFRVLSSLVVSLSFLVLPVSAQHHEHSHEVDKVQNVEQSELWTCSMHPQIKLPEPGKCPICGMDLIPLESNVGEGANEDVSLALSPVAKKLAQLQVSLAQRKAVSKQVRMVGSLKYAETNLHHITAWVPGRIDRMFVDYTGVRVRKGDHMIQLYSPELITAQEELIQSAKSVKRLSSGGSRLVKNSTQASYRAAREKLLLLGLTEAQVKEIEKRGTAEDTVTIYAPAAGVVVERSATEGMYVQTGTRIYSIADLSKLWLHLEAYETDLPWLRYGQKVTFSSNAAPGKQFSGTISFISPVTDPKTRTTNVRVNVENTNGELKPGLFVTGIVEVEVNAVGKPFGNELKGKYISPMHPEVISDEPGACTVCGMDLVPAKELNLGRDDDHGTEPLVIPVSAPLYTGKRSLVYVEDKEASRYYPREVTLGPRTNDMYVVLGGLSEGDRVVTNGAFKIDADLQIRGNTSMMNPASDAPDHNGDDDHAEHLKGGEDQGKKESASSTLVEIVKSYLRLSETLAADNLEQSRSAFRETVTAIQKSEQISISSLVIDEEEELNIDKIRAHFATISKELVPLASKYSYPAEMSVNKAYCPMALKNAGAYWLQAGDAVRNPYFGAMMLGCGSIEEQF